MHLRKIRLADEPTGPVVDNISADAWAPVATSVERRASSPSRPAQPTARSQPTVLSHLTQPDPGPPSVIDCPRKLISRDLLVLDRRSRPTYAIRRARGARDVSSPFFVHIFHVEKKAKTWVPKNLARCGHSGRYAERAEIVYPRTSEQFVKALRRVTMKSFCASTRRALPEPP